MDHPSPRYPDADRQARKSVLKGVCATLAIAFLAGPLGACKDGSATAVEHNMFVRTDVVQPRVRQRSVTLTGEVQARFRADLSFRVGGRMRERLVDVGARVDAGELLARLDAAEQQADFDAASAAVTAAQAQLRVAGATFRPAEPADCYRFHDARGCSIRRRKLCELRKARLRPRSRSWARPKRRLPIPSCAQVQPV